MATTFTTLTSPATPTITSPTGGATGVSRNPTITSSAFSSSESLSHTSSTWQIATDSGFSSIVWSKSADTTNKTSIIVNATNGTFAGSLSGKLALNTTTTYYVRVKYTDSESEASAYSTGVSFTTKGLTYTLFKRWVNEAFADYPVKVVKAEMVRTSDGIPEDTPNNGSLTTDTENVDLYYYSGAFKRILTSGNANTTEEIQDAVGAMIADTATIDLTYTDATPELKADLKTDSVNDTHIDWGSGANQVNLDDVPDGTSYEKVAAAELSSGIYKDATTAVKGIASFNTDDFTVTTGAVTIKDSGIDHTGLSNLNSANYTHLTATNHTDLTDGGATTLHKHDHGGQDGLGDDDHPQYVLNTGDALGGDYYFSGSGSGLVFGSFYGNEINFSTGALTAPQYKQIADTDCVVGQLNDVTYTDAGTTLTVGKAGMYLINYTISAESGTANTHLLSGITVNSTTVIQNEGRNHVEPGRAGAQYAMSGTAILSLAANDVVGVGVGSDVDNITVTVDHINLTVVQIGS